MLSSGTDNLKLSKKPGQAKQHQRKKSNMARLPLPGNKGNSQTLIPGSIWGGENNGLFTVSVALCIYPENRLILIRSLTNIRITKNTTHVKHAPHAFQAKHSKLCLAYYRDGYKITANP